MAELERLDWKAVDLERKFIEVRAGQAKTASRRVIPISDNLAAWLIPLERKGKIVRTKELQTHVPALARALKIKWPNNVLRHSFISYRIADVKSADQVALEAGNSPSIIFKHYRELTTEAQAVKWFSIMPKEGQWENTFRYDRRTRTVTLPTSPQLNHAQRTALGWAMFGLKTLIVPSDWLFVRRMDVVDLAQIDRHCQSDTRQLPRLAFAKTNSQPSKPDFSAKKIFLSTVNKPPMKLRKSVPLHHFTRPDQPYLFAIGFNKSGARAAGAFRPSGSVPSRACASNT
jgi:hypothetical protein